MEALNIPPDMHGELRLDLDGKWWHENTCFTHQRLIDLFHRSIVWDSSRKDHILKIGQWECLFKHSGYVNFVASLDDAELPWKILLLNGKMEALSPDTLTLIGDNRMVCRLANNETAIFLRVAHQTLAEHVNDFKTLSYGDRKITIQDG